MTIILICAFVWSASSQKESHAKDPYKPNDSKIDKEELTFFAEALKGFCGGYDSEFFKFSNEELHDNDFLDASTEDKLLNLFDQLQGPKRWGFLLSLSAGVG
eukprot:CAMPEP_0202977854 /NCGR_PEP_ID=MMETSP1396-20130829/84491_1 /ASSEMBLY_ACC=CAM_ASM_000872 /TAXON_ID= /ORGANISM="Pseudokeronopsis sp., Strain Brazil" /LENGTH=101 /DNA_ID=CAMNT_0049716669 /DNA_START=17 /DNA_END=322 /DNA_ORIENTATION=+